MKNRLISLGIGSDTFEIMDSILVNSTTEYVIRNTKSNESKIIKPYEICHFIEEIEPKYGDESTNENVYVANDFELEKLEKLTDSYPQFRPEILRLFWFRIRDKYYPKDSGVIKSFEIPKHISQYFLYCEITDEFITNFESLAKYFEIELLEIDINRIQLIRNQTHR